MYLGSFAIDDTCTFTCNTHTPATGAAVDADAVPTYRVYEDETTAPILNGDMAKLDDANTTGYYSEQITLSVANGFEYGKSYTVRIAAVVGGVTGITERHFSMGAKVNTTHVGGTVQTAGDLSAQISSIGSGTGAALNFAAETDNTGGALKSVTFVGSQTLTYAATSAEDGSRHAIADSAGTPDIDIVYRYNIGAGRNASKVVWKGLVSTGDTVTVQAYNGSTWDTRATISATGGTNVTRDIPLLSQHTGIGADAGLVFIRFTCTGQTNVLLSTDEMLVAGVNIGQTIGYADGSIWVDTTNGTAGTTPFVHGTADKPVLTWADALSLAASVGIRSFRFLPGSSITLTGSAAKYRFIGATTIALNGQSIADALFKDAYTISGVSTGDDAEFYSCGIASATIAHAYFMDCRFKGTLTLIAGQEYFIIRGTDAVTGTSTPAQFTYAANCEIDFRDWRGGLQLNSHVSTNTTFIDGAGRVVIDASCTGGAVTIRGHFNEATGQTAFVAAGGTVTDTARTAEDQSLVGLTGDVAGKVLGGGSGTITGVGVWAAGAAGSAVSLATDLATLAGKFAGITLLRKWLQGMARKDAMDATAKLELNEGGGAYNETTDSQEGGRDEIDGTLGTDGKVLLSTNTQADLSLGDVSMSGDFVVGGDFVIGDDVSIAGDVAMSGALVMGTDLVVGNDIDVGGDVIVAGVTPAMTLATDAVSADALSTAAIAEIVAAVFADTDEGLTYEGRIRLICSALLAKCSGNDANAPVFRDVLDTKNRITAATSTDGRTSVTLDAT